MLFRSNIIRNEIHARLRIATVDRHAMALSWVEHQKERVALIASRTRLRQLVESHRDGTISLEKLRADATTILLDAQQSTEGFLHISFTDADGRTLLSTNEAFLDRDISPRLAYWRGLSEQFLAEPETGRADLTADLSAPALDKNGDLLGVVLVQVDFAELQEIFAGIRGLDETGEILVGTLDGDSVRYLFPPRKIGRAHV